MTRKLIEKIYFNYEISKLKLLITKGAISIKNGILKKYIFKISI
jgi:hypothetical protein